MSFLGVFPVLKKTLAVKSLSSATQADYKSTPDLLPADVESTKCIA
jgi:hypothetical protein